jgi:hypothetical protein
MSYVHSQTDQVQLIKSYKQFFTSFTNFDIPPTFKMTQDTVCHDCHSCGSCESSSWDKGAAPKYIYWKLVTIHLTFSTV